MQLYGSPIAGLNGRLYLEPGSFQAEVKPDIQVTIRWENDDEYGALRVPYIF